jgi:hypothetical protein
MMPAERALEAEHLAINLGLRLVMQRQLVMSDRRAEIMLQRVALSQMPISGSKNLIIWRPSALAR